MAYDNNRKCARCQEHSPWHEYCRECSAYNKGYEAGQLAALKEAVSVLEKVVLDDAT